MYATSADWLFDKLPSNFGDKNSAFTDELKGMGALNFYWVQTSNSSGRSITIWPDQATAQAALYRIREGASADTGMKIAIVEAELDAADAEKALAVPVNPNLIGTV